MGALHREGKQQGMTYEEAREYLKTAEERGMKPGLDRMKELLFRLVSQLREYHTRYIFYSPVGLAVYAELQYMMESLASGEWFE